MRNKPIRWPVLVVLGAVALVFAGLVLPPMSTLKARSVRVSGVNTVAKPYSPLFAQPAPATNSGAAVR